MPRCEASSNDNVIVSLNNIMDEKKLDLQGCCCSLYFLVLDVRHALMEERSSMTTVVSVTRQPFGVRSE